MLFGLVEVEIDLVEIGGEGVDHDQRQSGRAVRAPRRWRTSRWSESQQGAGIKPKVE